MNSIVFGGINSATYGIYISGEGVWNAPERDAETVKIPGRNGEYVLDHGNFKNIEVTYPAFNKEASYNDFRTKVDNFRNAISSLKGYQRLTDSFHPDEYRMAAFIGGLEVDPILYNDKSMQMNIVFNCKPQRFLTSGETQSNVTSGGTITNPTLFESHPLLLVDGYGDFDINGEPITIQQGAVMGQTLLANAMSNPTLNVTIPLDSSLYLAGDTITLGNSTEFQIYYYINNADYINNAVEDSESTNFYPAVYGWAADNTFLAIHAKNGFTFTAGTASTIPTESVTFKVSVNRNGTSYLLTITLSLSISYITTPTQKIQITATTSISPTNNYLVAANPYIDNSPVYVDSTKSALGNLYIDLDIGECYRIENGQIISINTATTLPADLPVLNPGANTITYDNTFTSFKCTPRWWRV